MLLTLAAVAGAALVGSVVLPSPWRAIDSRVAQAVGWPALAVLVALGVALTSGLVAAARRLDATSESIGAEEPRLPPVNMGGPRTDVRALTVGGLEIGCGVSTVTFNLAVILAAMGGRIDGEGCRQRVRPACLLAEGAISAALGLDPEPLARCLRERPWEVRPEVVNLASLHPSGCALFCLPRAAQAPVGVDRLVAQIQRHHDVVLVDGGIAMSGMGEFARFRSDFFLLVGLPTEESVEMEGRWIEWVWGMRLETKTGLVLNRLTAWPPPPEELLIGFYYLAALPEERLVPAYDTRALPWGLDVRLPAAGQLVGVARQLFADLMPEAYPDAA